MGHETVILYASAVQGIASAVGLAKDARQWIQARRRGEMKRLVIHHPFWFFGLLAGCVLTAALGSWFFHPPHQTGNTTSPPQVVPSVATLSAAPSTTQSPVVNPAPPKTPSVNRGQSATANPQIIAPPASSTPSQPTAPIDCGAMVGNCGSGGGPQTFNQYGEPERKIKAQFLEELTSVLKANPGQASIMSNSNSDELTQQLYSLFVAAGWKPISIGTIMGGQSLPDGVLVKWRGSAEGLTVGQLIPFPDDRPDVIAVFRALGNSGVKHLTGVPDPNLPEHKISLEIGGTPK
jgi:hypothetical protein